MFEVTVLNADDPPADILLSWARNRPAGTVAGTLSVLPADADDTHTYTLTSGGDTFAIDGDALVTRVPLDHEASPYEIRVCVDDSAGGRLCEVLSVDVFNDNDPPTDIMLSHAGVGEGMPPGTEVGTLTAEDQDYHDIGDHRFELVPCADGTDADNPLFAIVDDRLVTNEALDFEARDAHDICVRARDWRDAFERRLVIRVVNLPDSLADAIRMLRVLAGADAGTVGVEGDPAGDGRVGLGDVVRILMEISAGDGG